MSSFIRKIAIIPAFAVLLLVATFSPSQAAVAKIYSGNIISQQTSSTLEVRHRRGHHVRVQPRRGYVHRGRRPSVYCTIERRNIWTRRGWVRKNVKVCHQVRGGRRF